MNITIWLMLIINYAVTVSKTDFTWFDGIFAFALSTVILIVSVSVEKDIKKLFGKE